MKPILILLTNSGFQFLTKKTQREWHRTEHESQVKNRVYINDEDKLTSSDPTLLQSPTSQPIDTHISHSQVPSVTVSLRESEDKGLLETSSQSFLPHVTYVFIPNKTVNLLRISH